MTFSLTLFARHQKMDDICLEQSLDTVQVRLMNLANALIAAPKLLDRYPRTPVACEPSDKFDCLGERRANSALRRVQRGKNVLIVLGARAMYQVQKELKPYEVR
jgi:hypothetical protein